MRADPARPMTDVLNHQPARDFNQPVLVLSHVFPNPLNPNAGIFVFDQVQELRRLGVKATVVAPSPWPPPLLGFLPRVRKYHEVPNRSEIAGCPVEYPKVLTLPGGWLFFLEGFIHYLRCRSLVRRMVKEKKVALIHAHTILPDGLAAVLLGREFKLPVVCTLHGSDIRVNPYRDRITLRLTRWTLRKVNRLVAVSSELKDKVFSLSGVSDVSVIRNSADPRAFKSVSKLQARTQLGLPPLEKKKMALFVGNLKPVKGVEFLLQAMTRLLAADVELYLVGDGESRSLLTEMVERLGVAGVCHFVGSRPHAEIPLWLAAADCLVLPSLSEGLPTIVVEAMFCKTPVVATNVGGTPEVVHDRRTGLLVEASDEAALARALTEILTDPTLAAALAQGAEAEVKGSLTWEANARSTIAAYEDVLLRQTHSADAATHSYASSSAN